MQVPVQVTFRGLPVSDEIAAACSREARKLERYASRITRCRVVVSAPHHRRVRGNLYEIRIDVTRPGRELVVNRVRPAHTQDEHIEIALREAFDTMRRRLEDEVRKRTGAVKAKESPAHGRVVRLDRRARHGFIRSSDGRDIYFHANSLARGGFSKLAAGTQVRFAEVRGADGPRASSVRTVGRHHHLST